MEKDYDVLIIGGGVSGSALFYALSKYSNAKRVALIERYSDLAQVSSKATNNSQTLHVGDIETHYTPEKAASVQKRAGMLARYVDQLGKEGVTHKIMQRMVLAVGAKEVADLKQHYQSIKHLFPEMRQLNGEALRTIEPAVMDGRDVSVPVHALYTERGYVMDYAQVARSFAEQGKKQGFDIRLGVRVDDLERTETGWKVKTSDGWLTARHVVVAAGAYSLGFAHRLGYAKDLTIIPVAGNFYQAPSVLKGKVYTMQIKGLPFAAIHGDPDVLDDALMRFGPIPIAMPLLEPRNWKTCKDFLRQFTFDWATLRSMIAINADPKLIRFLFKSFVYSLPVIGRRYFVRDVHKIIPRMRSADLTYGKGLGGIRPQVVNKKERKIQLGVAKIHGEQIIFNVTPSPGASVCLASAMEDAAWLADQAKGALTFDQEAMTRDFSAK